MIINISQRTNGQELAAHLLNEQDNEYVRVIRQEGTVAEDVPGFFEEIRFQKETQTKCINDLLSLSINPDYRKTELTEEQLDELIYNLNLGLGTVGQPQLLVEHIKNERRHFHLVISRIDTINEKAIEVPFDRLKTMMVVKNFCRDHGIELPDGYYKKFDTSKNKDKDFSLKEKFQFDKTGLNKAERMETVTELWHRRDNPESFINSLEFHGYTLCKGKIPYVLVDVFGTPNSLPKLIKDGDVRTKQIREFLGETRELPDADTAIEAARELMEQIKARRIIDGQKDRVNQLKQTQDNRRQKLEQKMDTLSAKNKQERDTLKDFQLGKRRIHQKSYVDEKKRIKDQREAIKPTGLAEFLGRVSGVDLVRKKIHQYQDKKRHEAYLSEKAALKENQARQLMEFSRKQEIHGLELRREKAALKTKDKHELKSLHKAFELEQSKSLRKGYEHMPGVQLKLTPGGRSAMVLRAKQRHTSPHAKEFKAKGVAEKTKANKVNLQVEFSAVTNKARRRLGSVPKNQTARKRSRGKGKKRLPK